MSRQGHLGLMPTNGQQQRLFARALLGLLLVGRCNLRLPLELLEPALQLDANVIHAGEILFGIGEAVLGLTATFAVLRYASRLLQEDAKLFGLGFNDPGDHALADDGVGAGAEARAQEHVVDILAPNGLPIDLIGGLAIARQHTLDRELCESAPGAAQATRTVVEDQFNAGAARRLAGTRAIENDVLHVLAAQLGGARLAQHPTHGIDHIGLAASIGADDAHQLPRNLQAGGVDEGFEAGEAELGESHGSLVEGR